MAFRSRGTAAGARWRRALLAALVTASVAVPVSGAAGPATVPAPVPAALGPLRAATPVALAERYAVHREGIRAAERMAVEHGDRKRAAGLRAMAGPERRFLLFDGRDGGRAAEVFGDLSRAENIAVLVPGSGVSLDAYGRLRRDATALARELGGRSAVVAQLGYRTPVTVSPAAITAGRADDAAPGLRGFVREPGRLKPVARTSLLCHSCGSVVCARAASGLEVTNIVLYGRCAAHAARTSLRHARLRCRPLSPEFGAEVFAAGGAGHSDYLTSGSVSLRNIGLIVRGGTALKAGDADGGA